MSKKVMNHILQQIAQQATPPDFDLWDRIERQIAPKAVRRLPRRRVSASFALAGAMLILFVALWAVRPMGNKQMPTGSSPTPTPTSAATIQATLGFYGVFTAQVGSIGTQDDMLTTYSTNVWFSAPEKHRYEMYISSALFHDLGNMPNADLRATAAVSAARATPEATTISNPYQLYSLDVSDGQRRWLYAPGRGGVIEEDPAEASEQVQLPTLYSVASIGRAGLAELMASLGATYDKVTLLREEDYLNRPTYVLQMQPRAGNNPILGNVMAEAHIVMWVDQQTFLQLKYEYYTASTTLRVLRMFTSLNFGITFDSTLFRLTLPTKAWTNAYVDTGLLQQSNGQWFAINPMWHQIAQSVPFNLYQPDFSAFDTSGLIVGKASYDTFSGTFSGPVYSAADPYGPPLITITEAAGTQTSGLQDLSIHGNGYATTGFYSEENGVHQLIAPIGDTLVILRTSDSTMTYAHLLYFANNFQYTAPWYKSYEMESHWWSIAQSITFPLYSTDSNTNGNQDYSVGLKQTAAGLPTYSDTSNTVTQIYYDTNQPVADVLVTESPTLPLNLDLTAAQSVHVGTYQGSYYLEKGDYRWLVIHAPGTFVTVQARINFVSRDDLFLFGASFQRVTLPSN